MALSIKDIIERNFFPGTVLMTGRESAGNLIGWVNVQEILDSTDMVQPGELLLTTGYDLGDFRLHQNLIPRMKSRGVVGMMIQTGYYQESVPVYLLEAGRKYHFPILELPAKYSFSEVLRTLITEISKDTVLDNHSFLDSRYFLPFIRERCLYARKNRDLSNEIIWLTAVSAANVYVEDTIELKEAYSRIRTVLTQNSSTYIGDSASGGQAVYCVALENAEQLKVMSSSLQVLLTELSDNRELQLFAAMDEVRELGDLEVSFRHCTKIFEMFHGIRALRGVCRYQHVDFLRRFSDLYRDNQIFARSNEVLQILLRKDREGEGDYLHTLRVLIEEQGNITKTAKRLFVHRHTLQNRLQVIWDLTGMDYEDYYSRLFLSLSMLIYDYYGI